MTYGGLKNCSSTTYIPRNISASRKYLLALSNEDSGFWSHLFGGGKRKPDGGGPAGVAALDPEEEKLAMGPRGRREEKREGAARR